MLGNINLMVDFGKKDKIVGDVGCISINSQILGRREEYVVVRSS